MSPLFVISSNEETLRHTSSIIWGLLTGRRTSWGYVDVQGLVLGVRSCGSCPSKYIEAKDTTNALHASDFVVHDNGNGKL
jgi:hypothetical protein